MHTYVTVIIYDDVRGGSDSYPLKDAFVFYS